MYTAYSYSLTNLNKPKRLLNGLRVTSRDLEILEFILEMKFSDLETIYQKFFFRISDSETSKSDWWARERISKLIKEGFIEKIKTISVRPFYILSEQGYHFLRNSLPTKSFCKPCFEIDVRTSIHDLKVQEVRILIERRDQITQWLSEKALTEDRQVSKFLPKEFRPDAIYTTSSERKVAFELEISRKSHQRYDDKIKRYLTIMLAAKASEKIFETAHFVCTDSVVFKILEDKTRLYRELFKIEMADSLLPEGDLK